nr:hypothetical protein [Actinomycetota bacterium]
MDGAVLHGPPDRRAQLVYFRWGQLQRGADLRAARTRRRANALLPIGARGACRVPDTELAVQIAAPEQATGTLVVDIGIIES